ncbi:MAG: hypothetical protein ABIH66_06855 [bacterium]
MPYANIDEAKEAGFPASVDDTELTLEQINHLASIYDSLREEPDVDDPMAAAIARFREFYEVQGDKWVPVEKKESGEVGEWGRGDVKNNTSPPPHSPTQFRRGCIIALGAVSLPEGGVEGGVIPGQIILHTGAWRDGDVEITAEILYRMLETHRSLSDKSTAPYLEPFVKSDHSLSVNDIIGHWENLRVEDIVIPTAKGSLDVIALVGDEVITNPEALEKIKRGEWTRRSAEFVRYFKDEATGEEFEWVLLGSAYVDIPEVTSIPPVQVPIAAAPTLEEAVVEMRRRWDELKEVRGAETEKPENRNNDEPQRLVKEETEGETERLRRLVGGVEREEMVRKLLDDCENLRRETAQRQEEVRRLRRERRLEELRRPGENGLALPESIVAFVREGMEKFGGTADARSDRIRLRRGGGEEEHDIGSFIIALAKELRDVGLVDTRILTSLEPRFEDDERKAERMAKERGHIG